MIYSEPEESISIMVREHMQFGFFVYHMIFRLSDRTNSVLTTDDFQNDLWSYNTQHSFNDEVSNQIHLSCHFQINYKIASLA